MKCNYTRLYVVRRRDINLTLSGCGCCYTEYEFPAVVAFRISKAIRTACSQQYISVRKMKLSQISDTDRTAPCKITRQLSIRIMTDEKTIPNDTNRFL